MECRIRAAVSGDCAMLWRWRNDPLTRRMQRASDAVPWRQFESWYARALANPERAILIASPCRGGDADDLGVAQFLLHGPAGVAEIGLNLNPCYRGRGLATPLIQRFCAEAQRALPFKAIVAHVKAENIPSRRAFARAGFTLDNGCGDILRFCRTVGDR